MKVLWFANTPCGAIEKLNKKKIISGGWLYALSRYISKREDIELHIAFYWNRNIPSFTYNGIVYHPIRHIGGNNRFTRLIIRYKRILGVDIDSEEIKNLRNVIDNVSPDIIHIHGTEENFGLVYRFNPLCPIVVSIQGLISPYLFKFYSGFDKRSIIKNDSILSKLVGLDIRSIEKLYNLKSRNEIESLKHIPYIIGRTFWDKACTEAINPKRYYFEVGEIMREEFYENKWNKSNFAKPLKLLSTVSGGLYKGLETIYYVAEILIAANIKFQWNVIGPSEDDLISKLSSKNSSKNTTDLNIRLLGRKEATEMVKIMKNSDIFIQVSHIENSPNSLCEAMLIGMPIIATFAGGTASLLNNGVEGILVQDGDPYVMAGEIIELSKNFKKAKEMGEKASLMAKCRHNPQKIINQLLEAYYSIIEKINLL